MKSHRAIKLFQRDAYILLIINNSFILLHDLRSLVHPSSVSLPSLQFGLSLEWPHSPLPQRGSEARLKLFGSIPLLHFNSRCLRRPWEKSKCNVTSYAINTPLLHYYINNQYLIYTMRKLSIIAVWKGLTRFASFVYSSRYIDHSTIMQIKNCIILNVHTRAS